MLTDSYRSWMNKFKCLHWSFYHLFLFSLLTYLFFHLKFEGCLLLPHHMKKEFWNNFPLCLNNFAFRHGCLDSYKRKPLSVRFLDETWIMQLTKFVFYLLVCLSHVSHSCLSEHICMHDHDSHTQQNVSCYIFTCPADCREKASTSFSTP